MGGGVGLYGVGWDRVNSSETGLKAPEIAQVRDFFRTFMYTTLSSAVATTML